AGGAQTPPFNPALKGLSRRGSRKGAPARRLRSRRPRGLAGRGGGGAVAREGGALAQAAGELPERLDDAQEDVAPEQPDERELRLALVRDGGARADGDRDEEHGARVEPDLL